jgi:precorrin-2 methylase
MLQKMVVNKIIDLLAKQFKLYDIMKYVKEPNDADERIDELERKVFQQSKLIEMLLINNNKEKK